MWKYRNEEFSRREEMLRARREHYLELLFSGMNSSEACRVVGVSKSTGKVWRNGKSRKSGRNEKPSVLYYNIGMNVKKLDKYFLSIEEREKIADMLICGHSMRKIAAELGRNVSTVSREIKRNEDSTSGEYRPHHANRLSQGRLPRPKARKIDEIPGLWPDIYSKLKNKWSPEQISNRYCSTLVYNGSMQISTETIYQSIYVQAKGELKDELKKLMRQKRVRRRPNRGSDEKKSRFRDEMVMISDRPAEIEDRAIPGHIEGDLITGAQNKSAIGTLVERTFGFIWLLHLPFDHKAISVQDSIVRRLKDENKAMCKSITWDQGVEMALHKNISQELDIEVYFCNPHSPWERGTNENTNGLLRQYFPKGTDLSIYSEEHLREVEKEMNGRPRKRLGWKTPSEAYYHFLRTGEIITVKGRTKS